MAERLACIQEVVGSTPIFSTMTFRAIILAVALSLVGLVVTGCVQPGDRCWPVSFNTEADPMIGSYDGWRWYRWTMIGLQVVGFSKTEDSIVYAFPDCVPL